MLRSTSTILLTTLSISFLAFPLHAQVTFGPEQIIDGNTGFPRGSDAIDMDGDGDIDLVNASFTNDRVSWYENDGCQNFTRHDISSNFTDAIWAVAGDFDGDSDIDVAAVEFVNTIGKVSWFENNGSMVFTENIIAQVDKPHSITVDDIDGDLDLDLLVPVRNGDRIALYTNNGTGTFAASNVVTGSGNCNNPRTCWVEDIDGDNDRDVLYQSMGSGTISWAENDGSQNFTAHVIANINVGNGKFISAADINGDSFMDVLMASAGANRISWFQNDGFQNFTENVISASVTNPFTIRPVDIDGDLDDDIVVAISGDDEIAWYENTGGTFGPKQTLSSNADNVQNVLVVDLDSDGDLDVVGAEGGDNEITWFEHNPGTLVWGDLGPTQTFCQGDSAFFDVGTQGATYLWENGSTDSTQWVSNGGYVSVDITVNLCTVTDSVLINVLNYPVVDLGPDTAICQGDSISLDAGTGGNTVLWNTTANTQTITASSSGIYSVAVSNNGCVTTDSIDLSITPNPVVNLGNDTMSCQGGNILLDAGNSGSSYQWSTGDSTQTISVNGIGSYWVIVNTSGCIGGDTIDVSIGTPPPLDLGNDTATCDPNPITIDAGNSGAQILWNTNEITSTIQVTSTGMYSVTVTDNGCSSEDSIYVAFNLPPLVDLGNDTTICDGTSIMLDAGTPGATYIWSTTETSQSISISTAGTYTVQVTENGCDAQDDIIIAVSALPTPDLGADVIICDEEVELSADTNYTAYLWQDGTTASSYFTSSPGLYTLTVTNAFGCVGFDQLEIFQACEPVLFIPNVFTPNSDGYNDVFEVQTEFITDFELLIFNRWGSQVFNTEDLNGSWDGSTSSGTLAPEGQYVYVINFGYSLGGEDQQDSRTGFFTLLR